MVYSHDVYLFSNLKGKREEWTPPLTLTVDEFWERVNQAHAVFIPRNYWRALIKQDSIIRTVFDTVAIGSGDYPVGVNNGVLVYSDAFAHVKTRGFYKPIVIIRYCQSHNFEDITCLP